jgi:hypothetical protein
MSERKLQQVSCNRLGCACCGELQQLLQQEYDCCKLPYAAAAHCCRL